MQSTMSCPICGGEARVLKSMSSEDGDSVIRRRKCSRCGCTFVTEEVDADYLEKLRKYLTKG